MYQKTASPDEILCVGTGELIPRGNRLWEDFERWVADGNAPSEPAPPFLLNSPEHYRYIRACAWEWMSIYVQRRRYDTIETCCSYFNSSVARFRDEARAMVSWRDAVNLALEQLVLNPPHGIETWDQVRPLLPQPETFGWPGEVELPLSTGESAVLE